MTKMGITKAVIAELVEARPTALRYPDGRTSKGSALTVCFEVAFYL